MKTWLDLNFELIICMDGSPTLKPLPDGQSMHHFGGALTETAYIYDKALEKLLEKLPKKFTEQSAHQIFVVRCLIVGLGLGYIELFLLKRFVLSQIESDNVFIQSHEAHTDLKALFQSWLTDPSNPEQKSSEPFQTYHRILDQICQTDLTGLPLSPPEQAQLKTDIFNFTKQLLDKNRWKFNDALNIDSTIPGNPFHLICFDAYSEKASPELWSEDFLNNFIEITAASDCVFTTYACTGRLTRALLRQQFQSLRSKGFMGKRNSTLMIKGFKK
jgi:tRNA U34 5-methylaminomethyl-2-thiouridine-forming methyltransferase MnmC